MSKKITTVLVAAFLAVVASSAAFAVPKNNAAVVKVAAAADKEAGDIVIDALKDAKVPGTYENKAKNYLKTHDITVEQANFVADKISYISELVKQENVTDLSKLSSDSKDNVISAITEAASEIDLKVSVYKNSDGKRVLVISDAQGNVLTEVSAADYKLKNL